MHLYTNKREQVSLPYFTIGQDYPVKHLFGYYPSGKVVEIVAHESGEIFLGQSTWQDGQDTAEDETEITAGEFNYYLTEAINQYQNP